MSQHPSRRPMHARVAVVLWGAISLASCVGVFADEKPEPSLANPQTFQDIIAARPAPDLTTLARRSSPATEWPESGESFHDLLKLRETADVKAVPVLKQVLADNAPTTRIHGFAAAQALFAIGTPEAHQILGRQMLAEGSHAGLAEMYTSHWEMREPLRSRFIERYLLKNLSKSLVVEVEQAPSPMPSNGRLNLGITFRNVSDEAFHVLDHKTFPGDMLYLRDATGRYMPRVPDRRMCKDQSKSIELKPGQAHRVNVTIDVAAVDDLKRVPRTTGELMANVREAVHFFDIDVPGRFDVLALFEAAPLTDEGRKFLKVDQDGKWWSGRAVSKPLTIDIALPAQP